MRWRRLPLRLCRPRRPQRLSKRCPIRRGSIRNRGVEILLTGTPYERGKLSWLMRTTFAKNVGIVTELPPGVTAFNAERDATGQRVAFGPGYGIGRLQVGEPVTQIVPGHGPVATRDAISKMRQTLLEMIALADVPGVRALERVQVPEAWREWGLPSGFRGNLQFLFNRRQP